MKNIDLVIKTIRTRTARLVSEIGCNLPSILDNLALKIQKKNFSEENGQFEEMGFDDIDDQTPN